MWRWYISILAFMSSTFMHVAIPGFCSFGGGQAWLADLDFDLEFKMASCFTSSLPLLFWEVVSCPRCGQMREHRSSKWGIKNSIRACTCFDGCLEMACLQKSVKLQEKERFCIPFVRPRDEIESFDLSTHVLFISRLISDRMLCQTMALCGRKSR